MGGPALTLSFVDLFLSLSQSVTACLYVVFNAKHGQELYSVIVRLHALSLVDCNHSQLKLASLVTIIARSSIVQNERNIGHVTKSYAVCAFCLVLIKN